MARSSLALFSSMRFLMSAMMSSGPALVTRRAERAAGATRAGAATRREEPARLRGEESAGGTSKSARRVRSLARTAPRGVATAAGRYPPHFSVGEEARRRGRGRRAVGGKSTHPRRADIAEGRTAEVEMVMEAIVLACVRGDCACVCAERGAIPRVRWERSKRGRRWMG